MTEHEGAEMTMPHFPHAARAALVAVTMGALATAGASIGVQQADAQQADTQPSAAIQQHPAPSHFTKGRVDNPWFPLRPGTRYIYRGVKDQARTKDVMTATYLTKTVDGVVCR